MKSERKEIDFDLLKRLFWVMFSLSACTFGGGFVIVSLMKKKVVEEQHWLEEDEMLGSLVAVFGTILPPMILLSVIAVFYDQFRSNETIKTALAVMRAGVAAVIFDVVINLAKNVIATKRILYIALMIITFIMGYFLKVSAMIIILSCLGTGLICVIYDLITQQKKRKEISDMPVILKLFISFFQVGLFSVGGGYAAIPLIQNQIVNVWQLMTLEEFADLITIAEMTPGPISINSATFVGMRLAGVPGAIVCTFACILMPFTICLILAYYYYKYRSLKGVQTVLGCLRPAVVSLVSCAGLSILTLAIFQTGSVDFTLSNLKFIEIGLFLICLFLIRKYKLGAIPIIFGSGVVGTFLYIIFP